MRDCDTQMREVEFFGCAAGPSGFTVREIIRQTDADIKSWTDKCEDDTTRPTRTFIIEVLSLPPGSLAQLTLTLLTLHVLPLFARLFLDAQLLRAGLPGERSEGAHDHV